MASKKFLFDWTGFFAKHITGATIENAAKQDVVLTFAPPKAVKAFARSVAAEFTLVGKTVDLLTLNYTLGKVTIHVTMAYGAGAGFDLTFDSVKKGDTAVIPITNNIL